MAGGPHADRVPCIHCGGCAIRRTEGLENDWYRCTQCCREFGIDWSGGPPTTRCWPPALAADEALLLMSGAQMVARLWLASIDFPRWSCRYERTPELSSLAEKIAQNPVEGGDLPLAVSSRSSGLLAGITHLRITDDRIEFELRPNTLGRYSSNLGGD